MDYKKDIKEYFERVKATIDKVPINDLNNLLNLLNQARDNGKFVFICGNGGAASTPPIFVAISTKAYHPSRRASFVLYALATTCPP